MVKGYTISGLSRRSKPCLLLDRACWFETVTCLFREFVCNIWKLWEPWVSLKTTQPYNHYGFKAKDGIGAAAPVNFEKQPVKNTNDHLIHSFCTLLLVKYRFYIQRHALLLVALEIKRSSRLTKFLLGNKQILQLQSYRNCLESKIECMEMYKYKKEWNTLCHSTNLYYTSVPYFSIFFIMFYGSSWHAG